MEDYPPIIKAMLLNLDNGTNKKQLPLPLNNMPAILKKSNSDLNYSYLIPKEKDQLKFNKRQCIQLAPKINLTKDSSKFRPENTNENKLCEFLINNKAHGNKTANNSNGSINTKPKGTKRKSNHVNRSITSQTISNIDISPLKKLTADINDGVKENLTLSIGSSLNNRDLSLNVSTNSSFASTSSSEKSVIDNQINKGKANKVKINNLKSKRLKVNKVNQNIIKSTSTIKRSLRNRNIKQNLLTKGHLIRKINHPFVTRNIKILPKAVNNSSLKKAGIIKVNNVKTSINCPKPTINLNAMGTNINKQRHSKVTASQTYKQANDEQILKNNIESMPSLPPTKPPKNLKAKKKKFSKMPHALQNDDEKLTQDILSKFRSLKNLMADKPVEKRGDMLSPKKEKNSIQTNKDFNEKVSLLNDKYAEIGPFLQLKTYNTTSSPKAKTIIEIYPKQNTLSSRAFNQSDNLNFSNLNIYGVRKKFKLNVTPSDNDLAQLLDVPYSFENFIDANYNSNAINTFNYNNNNDLKKQSFDFSSLIKSQPVADNSGSNSPKKLRQYVSLIKLSRFNSSPAISFLKFTPSNIPGIPLEYLQKFLYVPNSKTTFDTKGGSIVNNKSSPSKKLADSNKTHAKYSFATTRNPWVCSFCSRKTFGHRDLGELYGPFTVLTRMSRITDAVSTNPVSAGIYKRSQSAKADTFSTLEDSFPNQDLKVLFRYYFHTPCIVWATHIQITPRGIDNLDVAVTRAFFQQCSICKEGGANLSCQGKNCSRQFHYLCGYHNGYLFEESTYTIYCNEHKNLRIQLMGVTQADPII